jgi:hypothetical protein
VPILRIDPIPGYSPTIGRLVCILTHARHTLIAAANGLGQRELAHLQDPASNSIGALLAHAVAVERTSCSPSRNESHHLKKPHTGPRLSTWVRRVDEACEGTVSSGISTNWREPERLPSGRSPSAMTPGWSSRLNGLPT